MQILLGLLFGVAYGYLYPHAAPNFKLLSDIFIHLINLVVGPIIFCTIVLGITSNNSLKETGRIGLSALIYFEVVTTLALLIGLITMHLLHPGTGISVEGFDYSDVAHFVEQAKAKSLYTQVLEIFPLSLFDALAKNDLIQILVSAVLFGMALSLIGEKGAPIRDAIKSLSEVIFGILHLVVYFAPFAVFGAMSFTVSTLGLHTLINLGEVICTVYLAMGLFVVIVLGGICRIIGESLWDLLVYLKEEIFIVLGTSSSEAVLPQLIEKLTHYGCSEDVVGLVVPTGYSFNLDGTSIYLAAAVTFIAQAYGIELDWWQEGSLLILLMINSKGAAAVTGGGFITLAATLSDIHVLPVEGIILLLGVDRFMSQARSLTNLIGNAVATLVISKHESSRGQKSHNHQTTPAPIESSN